VKRNDVIFHKINKQLLKSNSSHQTSSSSFLPRAESGMSWRAVEPAALIGQLHPKFICFQLLLLSIKL
jgi:hypothetical protein